MIAISITFGSPEVQAHTPKNQVLKIGILANRGKENCLHKWQATADYLDQGLPGFSFQIIPLGFHELLPAVENREIDFVLANPAYYVMAEKKYYVQRMATLSNKRLGTSTTHFGGVLFTLADNPDIKQIKDLKGKTFAAVSPFSLGGWLAGRLEMVRRGLDPERDLAHLQFLETHDAVVLAVLQGKAQAGTVRSDILERMQSEGKVRLKDLRVLEPHHSARCKIPFVHSTRNYPEWPFAQLDHLDNPLAGKICALLLNMPENCPAAAASRSMGWSIPGSYEPVRENLREQRIGPWVNYGQVTFRQAVLAHLHFVIAGGVLVFLLGLISLKLNHSRLHLRELAEKQKQTLTQLHLEEARLVQTEKLATLGQVAAGVAHEINNPVGFIMSNLFTLQEYFVYLKKLISNSNDLAVAKKTGNQDQVKQLVAERHELLAEDDPDFICTDGRDLIKESLDGAFRIKEIVLNLKNMAQIDTSQWCPLNLNEGITAVFGVANSRPGFEGNIHLDLEELPDISGHPGELNQAILNLLTNATQFSPEDDRITVSSRFQEDTVLIQISDNGPGIPTSDLGKVFNPFFTTLPAGHGSGLGLPLARDIISRHGGTIKVESQPGRGAAFTICLPVHPQKENAPAPV